MNIKEIDYIPDAVQQKFIDYLLGQDFPWYFEPKNSIIKTDFFFHSFMNRSEENIRKEGKINSSLYEDAKNIFLEVCKQGNLEVKTIFRACVNSTYYFPENHTGIHKDHNFSHKNFILHLTETNAPTYIYDDLNDVIAISNPKKYRAVTFDGLKHSQGSPVGGERRVVLVFTYE